MSFLQFFAFSALFFCAFGCRPAANNPGTPNNNGNNNGNTGGSNSAVFTMDIAPPISWTNPTNSTYITPRQQTTQREALDKIRDRMEFQINLVLIEKKYPSGSISVTVDNNDVTADVVGDCNGADLPPKPVLKSITNNIQKCNGASAYTISGELTATGAVTTLQWQYLAVLLRQKLEKNEKVIFPQGELLKVTPL